MHESPGGTELGAGVETICVHFGEDRKRGGPAAPPLYQSSTFLFPTADDFEHRQQRFPHADYTRVGNPTTALLEGKLAQLERAQWARCFGSGMGAVAAAINASVCSGAHVVALKWVYGPTRYFLESYLPRFGVSATFVNSVDPDAILAACRPETKLLYLESPTSLLFEVPRIAPLTRAARERGILTAFDNSWASPLYLNPLEHGIDLVIHSATKYIGGHSDVVAGVVLGRDAALRAAVSREAEFVGATIDPFASWLLLRGLRTLPVRMQHHHQAGLAVARWLEAHPAVRRVRHPGLESHPQHAIAREQLRGFAGVFSFELADGSRDACHRVLDRLRLFGIGVSWGGHESLAIGLPLRLDGATHYVIRVHVGLETPVDLVADLRQALEG